jgi:hypothetical protein
LSLLLYLRTGFVEPWQRAMNLNSTISSCRKGTCAETSGLTEVHQLHRLCIVWWWVQKQTVMVYFAELATRNWGKPWETIVGMATLKARFRESMSWMHYCLTYAENMNTYGIMAQITVKITKFSCYFYVAS